MKYYRKICKMLASHIKTANLYYYDSFWHIGGHRSYICFKDRQGKKYIALLDNPIISDYQEIELRLYECYAGYKEDVFIENYDKCLINVSFNSKIGYINIYKALCNYIDFYFGGYYHGIEFREAEVI